MRFIYRQKRLDFTEGLIDIVKPRVGRVVLDASHGDVLVDRVPGRREVAPVVDDNQLHQEQKDGRHVELARGDVERYALHAGLGDDLFVDIGVVVELVESILLADPEDREEAEEHKGQRDVPEQVEVGHGGERGEAGREGDGYRQDGPDVDGVLRGLLVKLPLVLLIGAVEVGVEPRNRKVNAGDQMRLPDLHDDVVIVEHRVLNQRHHPKSRQDGGEEVRVHELGVLDALEEQVIPVKKIKRSDRIERT